MIKGRFFGPILASSYTLMSLEGGVYNVSRLAQL